jgi:hypothetical protein
MSRYDTLEEWRERRRKFVEERSAEYARDHPEQHPSQQALDEARQHFGPVITVVGRMLARELDALAKDVQVALDGSCKNLREEIEVTREHMKRLRAEVDELRGAVRTRRRKKPGMSRAEQVAYVMRQKGLPEEAFEK